MSDPAVTAYLTKLLCSHGGRLERNRLSDLLELPEEQIEQILQEEPLRFPQSSQLVLARSPLKICTRYLRPGGEGEEDCQRLHLCRHYLRGQCPPNRRPRCRFSHDVQSDHNRAVLRANELSGLNEDEIKVLLFQNDSQLLPEDCRNYMQDNCDQGENCARLHVCSFFARGNCHRRFCKKSHNLLDSKLLFTCNWLSQEAIQNFQMLCVLKHKETQRMPREEHRNGEPRGPRGMSRGRGRPGGMRRAGSQDLLNSSSSRGRRNDGPHSRWRSSSRPPSQCSMGQRSGDEDHEDSDSSGDYGRNSKTRLDNLMSDWFAPNTTPSEKQQARSGIMNGEGTRFEPLNKGPVVSSGVKNPVMYRNAFQPMEVLNSRVTFRFPRASYNTQEMDNDSSNAPSVGQVPSYKSYDPNPRYSTGQNVQKERSNVPVIPRRTEQSVYYPPPLTESSRPTQGTLQHDSIIALPKPSTNSSTSFNTSREHPYGQPHPKANTSKVPSSPFNKPVHSAGGSSSAEASSHLTASSTLNQKTVMESDKVLGSSMARLSITPSTPFKTSLYDSKDISSITQPKPATPIVSGHMGASSSSNDFVDFDRPCRNPQACVKPIIKNDPTNGIKYSLSDEDLEMFLEPPKVINLATTQPATNISCASPGKSLLKQTPEICLTHIWKYCNMRDKCANMHYWLPYRWQVFSGTDWDDFSNMELIEKAYSDPKIDSYGFGLIDFQTMKSGSKPVRRLTTPSSVTQPELVLTTEWCWYWKNELGTWIEYGKPNTSTTILSSDLETIYQSDPTAIIPFTAGNQTYIIDFQEMKQKNSYLETEREVRRRPKFLDRQNVNMLRGSTKSATDSIRQKQSDCNHKNGIYPPHWDLKSVPEIGYTKVLLPQYSSEYTNIVAMFNKTVYNHTVQKIWRLQNSALWELYQWKKDQMIRRNLSSTVDERQLFHGTDLANIDAICRQNFDWRICGTHATAFGQGSYFARDASYSHDYSPPTSAGIRTMFMARVLVGDFIKGDHTMKRPPQKKSGSQSYDSCVDNIYNPSIFVVFDKEQVYPEYILEYRRTHVGIY